MSGVIFYTLILSFASGIFLRSFLVVDVWTAGWVGLLTVGLGLWAYRRRSMRSVQAVVLLAVVCAGGALGLARFNLVEMTAPAPVLLPSVGTIGTYSGYVMSEPELGESTANVVVLIGDERVLVKTDRHTSVQYGDTVDVTGKLATPESFVTDTGRTFDYPGYLRARGIAYTMSYTNITVTDDTTGNPILCQLFSYKKTFIEALQLALPEPEVGLGVGLLLGVKQSLGADLEEAFRRAGIIHIVVLSGYNIMIIVGFVMVLLGRFLPVWAQVVIGIVAIVLFAFLVGAGASVVRASIMAVLGLIAILGGRRYAVLRALFLAGWLMLVYNPYLLVFDVGFQLSFMATLGLILVAPGLESAAGWVPTQFSIRQFLFATVATQIAVLPILLYHMGQFSVIAVVVNILVLPVVPVAMLVTFLTGLVALVSQASAIPLAYITYVVLAYIITLATTFAALPYAVVTVPVFSGVWVPLFYLVLGYGLYWYYKRQPAHLIPDVPTLVGWTIVEESEAPAGGIPNTSKKPATPANSSSTPIFFR